MTLEEFEARYAARSGVTVAELHAYGRYAEPCDCDSDMCTGWAMGHPWEDAIVEDALRHAGLVPPLETSPDWAGPIHWQGDTPAGREPPDPGPGRP